MPVAGRFPAAGATCCRKRIPPPAGTPALPTPCPRARHGTRYGGSALQRFLRRLASALSLSLSLSPGFLPVLPGLWGWGPPSAKQSRRRAGSGGSLCTRPGSGGGWQGCRAVSCPQWARKDVSEALGYLLPSIEVRGLFACPRLRDLGKLAASQNIFWLILLVRGGFCCCCCCCCLFCDFFKGEECTPL